MRIQMQLIERLGGDSRGSSAVIRPRQRSRAPPPSHPSSMTRHIYMAQSSF